MPYNNDFPFGIEFVVNQLDLKRNKNSYKSSFNVECPFCGDIEGKKPRYKLSINTQKNVWRCAKCGEYGGMLDLYMRVKHLTSRGETAKILKEIYFNMPEGTQQVVKTQKEEAQNCYPDSQLASLEVRNGTYQALLKRLTLNKEHYDDLKRRGLSDETIVRNGYKSYPQKNLTDLGCAICMFDEEETEGVPGFEVDRQGLPKIVRRNQNGYFIPIKSMFEGYIEGMQIRNDALPQNASEYQKENYRKYVWFSSGGDKYKLDYDNKGTSVTGIWNINHSGFSRLIDTDEPIKHFDVIGLTEGALKSDICAELSGIPFLGLTGVSNYGLLAKDLIVVKKVYQVKRIVICMDMDREVKPEVEKATKKIHEIVLEAGFDESNIKELKWNREYKGFDDFLLEWTKRKNQKERKN